MSDENAPRILTRYNETQKTLDNATTSYKLDMGFLEENTRTFALRLWMDEDTPPVEEAMNKIFKSKVTITSVYEEKMPGTLHVVYRGYSDGLWVYKRNITKLVFQDKLEKIPNAIKTTDESSLKDGSIMSYVVLNEDGRTYTAYLQGNKVMYLNPDSSYFFAEFSKLQIIEGMEYLDTKNVTNMSSMFDGCSSLTSLDLSPFKTENVTNMYSMFHGCSSLKSLDLSPLDTTNVIHMSFMFGGCSGLTRLDLSPLKTKNVTTMLAMFSGCSSLTSLDLSPLDTTNVTNMSSMFFHCSKLTSLDLSPLDTTNVTNMSSMFYNCSKLTSLDLSPLDTTNVTDMNSMFSGCNNLTGLDLSSFNTEKVTDMGGMFKGCRSITSLNLGSFNTGNVTSYYHYYGMFEECINLTTINYVENFVYKAGATTTNMFKNCPANKPTHESWNGVRF